DLPRRLQMEFSKTIQLVTEESGTEISPGDMWDHFADEYLDDSGPLELLSHEVTTGDEEAKVTAQVLFRGEHKTISGAGSGPLDAFVHGLRSELGLGVEITDYVEHAVSSG